MSGAAVFDAVLVVVVLVVVPLLLVVVVELRDGRCRSCGRRGGCGASCGRWRPGGGPGGWHVS